MAAPSKEFEPYVADDESVVHGARGTLIDGTHRSAGTIGVTDRRVLFRSDGDRFMDVAHDAIASIQSRPRTTYTYRGIGYRLLVCLGACVAVLAVLGVLVLRSSALAIVLAIVTVGGAVGAEYVRRHGVDVSLQAPRAIGGRSRPLGGGEGGALDDANTDERTSGGGDRRTPGDEGREPLVLGSVVVSLVALIGLIVLTGRLLVVPLALVAVGGIALTDVANRWRRALDDVGGSRRREREVSIHLLDGRRIRLRVDDARRIEYELSGLSRRLDGNERVPALPGGDQGPAGRSPDTGR